MANYLSGFVVIFLIALLALLGLEVHGLYAAYLAVDSAALAAERPLSQGGGLTPAVEGLVTARLQAAGLDPAPLRLDGTPPAANWGDLVWLEVEYPYPYLLTRPAGGLQVRHQRGVFIIRRRVVTISAAAPER